jgi:DNA-binding NtrC family response regulator
MNPAEVSQTSPHRGGSREVTRSPTLLLAGSGSSLASMRATSCAAVGDGIIIGRRPATAAGGYRNLVLSDRSVSSLHARIVKLAGDGAGSGYAIQDLGSTNGTLVDGRPIGDGTPLRSGSVIFLGGQVLVFRMVSPAELGAIEEEMRTPFAPVPTLSPSLALACAKLRRLARSDSEIFLVGETGVGKEVFARAIHEESRRAGPLVAINCAAIPRELVESELFGYEKGAHSTAQGRKAGLIEAAQGGTLFLDELGEMPPEIQAKLLRFLQDRKFMPLGSTRTQEADVRIIAASSRSSMGGRAAMNIQEALLGRLGAQPIQLPALRDRVEDIGRLVAFFLSREGAADRARERAFDSNAFHALFLHDWPHNIRELQKVINEAQLLSAGAPMIGFEHLPESVTAVVEAGGDDLGATPDDLPGGDALPVELTDAAGTRAARTRRPPPTADELTDLLGLYQGNVAHVARHLNRQYAVVWRCIQRYGINADRFRPAKTPAPEGPVAAQAEGEEAGVRENGPSGGEIG